MSSKLRILGSSTMLLAGLAAWGFAGQSGRAAEKPVAVPGLPPQAKEWQSCPADGPIDGVRIENFGVVSPGCLYRSAQPGEGDFEWLAEQGFRSVISLRKERDDDAERVKALGMSYLYLPVTDYRIPTDDQAHEFLVFVRDAKNWPALVHCAGGQGRAGIMAALARYSIDGWTMGEALREAKEYRPFNFRIFGEQRRFLNRWKDRFPPGAYHPSKPLPQWPPVQNTAGGRRKAGDSE
jgi:protein tyrosine phosphatase (PTP) superfamily phosphohydrolase (DUF442 family)